MRNRVLSSRCLLLSLAVFGLLAGHLDAQPSRLNHPQPPPVARAVKRSGPIQIDGKVNEAAWDAATPVTKFTQSDPEESKPATQRTEVRFLYDDDALYVGARMYDSLGAKGVATRLVRHDQAVEGNDLFQLIFDIFHDHQGRAGFAINPSGVRNDALGSGQQNPDPAWDPVYESATTIDSLGWSAELKIPFSQFRYPRTALQTWGLQMGNFDFTRDRQALFTAHPDNIFVVKMNYYLGR